MKTSNKYIRNILLAMLLLLIPIAFTGCSSSTADVNDQSIEGYWVAKEADSNYDYLFDFRDTGVVRVSRIQNTGQKYITYVDTTYNYSVEDDKIILTNQNNDVKFEAEIEEYTPTQVDLYAHWTDAPNSFTLSLEKSDSYSL